MAARKRDRAEAASSALPLTPWDPATLAPHAGVPQTELLLTHGAAADPATASRMLAQLCRDEAAAAALAAAARQRFLEGRFSAAQAASEALHALPGALEAAAVEDIVQACSGASGVDPTERLAEWGIALSAEALAVVHATAAGPSGAVAPAAAAGHERDEAMRLGGDDGAGPEGDALMDGAGGQPPGSSSSSSSSSDDGTLPAASSDATAPAAAGPASGGDGAAAASRAPQQPPAPELVIGQRSEASERAYRGRPVRGATSGALFLHAEWETGGSHPPYPPPARSTAAAAAGQPQGSSSSSSSSASSGPASLHASSSWRYLVGEGADGPPRVEALLLASSGGGGGGGAGGARVLDAGLVAQAREALKRPAFPDRRQPTPRVGAGSTGNRGLALAVDFDEAAAIAARCAEVTQSVLAQLGGVS